MAINLKGLKVNVPQIALEDYFWVIAGVPKAGKTSLFANITKEYFGDMSKSILLAFEKGYQALQVQAQDVNDWSDFDEIVDQLIDDKKELGIELIGIDTADILFEMATAEVIREWNTKNPSKRTKDIGGVGAKGKSDQGFGVGYQLVRQKIRGNIDKLQKAGYGVMVLTHSKDKKIEQKDGLEYDQLNVSLPSSAREIFINMADFIVFITIEKEKVDDEILTKRYMYFRSDGFVEAGSRFKNVPLRIEYDTKEFLNVFKHAVQSEFDAGVSLEQIKEEQAARKEKAAEAFIQEQKSLDTPEDLIAVLDNKIKGLTDEQKTEGKISEKFKKVLGGTNNYKKVDDIELLKKCIDIVDKLV
jgi:hypothetical protein